MKLVLNIVAILLIITGIVWILQGINILPGSFMTGNTHWTLAGLCVLCAAGLLLYFTNRILR
jgi:glucose dehydrogenase